MNIFSWLKKNKEWMFSGLGVAIITIVIGVFFNQKTDDIDNRNVSSEEYITEGDNITAGRDVTIYNMENRKNEGELEITGVRFTHDAEFDVLLRNLGDVAIIIHKIEIEKINDPGIAVEPILNPSARYVIEVDDIKVGESKSIDISHVIDANKADRILIATESTTIYGLKVTFYYNNDKSIYFIENTWNH